MWAVATITVATCRPLLSLLVVVVLRDRDVVGHAVTRPMRLRRRKLAEILRWKPTSARSVLSLPRLASSSGGGGLQAAAAANSFTFSISDGLRWKVSALSTLAGHAVRQHCGLVA